MATENAHSVHSSFRNSAVRHLFTGQILQIAWNKQDFDLDIAQADSDAHGYSFVMSKGRIVRHVSLRSSVTGASTAKQNINSELSNKPSACLVWLNINSDTLEFESFRFFGSSAGEPLVLLDKFKTAKHTKGDADGFKAERQQIREIPKGAFTQLPAIEALYEMLFSNNN